MIVAGVGHIKIDGENPFETGRKVATEALENLKSRAKKEKINNVEDNIKLSLVFCSLESQSFSIDAELEDDLNKSRVSEKLENIFKTNGFSLSGNAIVTGGTENEWVITDEEKIIVRKEDGELKVFPSSDSFLRELIRGVRKDIKAPLLGSTSTGNISTEKVTNNSIVCLVLASDTIFIGTSCARFGDSIMDDVGKEVVKSAYSELQVDIMASPSILGGYPKYILLGWLEIMLRHSFRGGVGILAFPTFSSVVEFAPRTEDIINGIKSYFGPFVPIIGGMAADPDFWRPRVFFNDNVLENAVACAVFLSINKFGLGIGLGLVPTDKKYKVTKLEGAKRNHFIVGRKISEIKDENAPKFFFERIKRLCSCSMNFNKWIDRVRKGKVTGMEREYLQYPFGCTDRFGILRSLIPYVITEDYLEYGMDIAEDTILYDVTSGDTKKDFSKNIKESVKHAIKEALGKEEPRIKKNTIEAIFIFSCAIKKWRAEDLWYLCSWDDVPGKDSERLLKFLRDDFDIRWAGENAKIHKSDDRSKTIRIRKGENTAKIKIDEDEEKATLKISDGRTYGLIVKKENGKLNIYELGFSTFDMELESVKEELGLQNVPIIGFYTFGEICSHEDQAPELLSHSFSVIIISKDNFLPPFVNQEVV